MQCMFYCPSRIFREDQSVVNGGIAQISNVPQRRRQEKHQDIQQLCHMISVKFSSDRIHKKDVLKCEYNRKATPPFIGIQLYTLVGGAWRGTRFAVLVGLFSAF